MLKWASEGKKFDDVYFFFRASGSNQPTGVHSDPGNPLASSLKKSYEEHIAKLEALNVAAKDKA